MESEILFEVLKVEKSIFNQFYVYPTISSARCLEKLLSRKLFEHSDSITVEGDNFHGDRKAGKYILKFVYKDKFDITCIHLTPEYNLNTEDHIFLIKVMKIREIPEMQDLAQSLMNIFYKIKERKDVSEEQWLNWKRQHEHISSIINQKEEKSESESDHLINIVLKGALTELFAYYSEIYNKWREH